MKYIRTKEHGVCKVINEDKYTITYENKDVVGCMDKDAYKMQQADTIEKLCDGFIGVHDKEWFRKNRVATKGINYFQKPFELEYGIYKKDFANLKLKNQNGWEYTAIEWQRNEHNFIFGYIETDKGLIYVAKMNEKGELELL